MMMPIVSITVTISVSRLAITLGFPEPRCLGLSLAAPALVNTEQQRVVHQVQLGQELLGKAEIRSEIL